MADRDRVENLGDQFLGEQRGSLGLARGAENSDLTRKCQQMPGAALRAADSCEAGVELSTLQIGFDGGPDDGAQRAVPGLEAVFIFAQGSGWLAVGWYAEDRILLARVREEGTTMWTRRLDLKGSGKDSAKEKRGGFWKSMRGFFSETKPDELEGWVAIGDDIVAAFSLGKANAPPMAWRIDPETGQDRPTNGP